MALAGEVKVINCGKGFTCTLILQDERDMHRGDSAGTGKFVCGGFTPVPGTEVSHAISSDWQAPYIDLKIEVLKKENEVSDPREGIKATCLENCVFNKERQRKI